MWVQNGGGRKENESDVIYTVKQKKNIGYLKKLLILVHNISPTIYPSLTKFVI